jgi:hypothetical protein
MSLLSDLRVLFRMTLSPVRGKTHAERLESFYAGQADDYDGFREHLLHGRRELYGQLPVSHGGVWVEVDDDIGGVAAEDGKWNTALTEKITGELLVRFNARGGVDGIFAMADNQATGSIQAVESAGLKLGVADKGIVVVGSNCMKDGMINIKSGKQFATATQIPTEEAEITAKKIAAHQLHDPATVVGRDHVIGAVVRFGQDTRFLGATFGLIKFAQPCVNDGAHHAAKHQKAGSGCSRRDVFRCARKQRSRLCDVPLCIPISPSQKIGLAKAVFDKAKPTRVVHLVGQGDGFFRHRDRFIRRSVEIQRRRPDRDGGQPPSFIANLPGPRLPVVTKTEPFLDTSKRHER